MGMILKQVIGTEIVGLGLTGALHFGGEVWRDTENLIELNEKRYQAFLKEPNKSEYESKEAYKNYVMGLIDCGPCGPGVEYLTSIFTVIGGAWLIAYDELKEERK